MRVKHQSSKKNLNALFAKKTHFYDIIMGSAFMAYNNINIHSQS